MKMFSPKKKICPLIRILRKIGKYLITLKKPTKIEKERKYFPYNILNIHVDVLKIQIKIIP